MPVAKAYSGLSDEEIRELDAWIRRHTREKFGPTRAVEPVQVFELAFEGIAPSTRHKSGRRRALPAHRALAQGQAGGGGGHARCAEGHAAGELAGRALVLEGEDLDVTSRAKWTSGRTRSGRSMPAAAMSPSRNTSARAFCSG